MPIPAWSLVGFLSESEALAYLQQACMMSNKAPGALRTHYHQARRHLGTGAVAHPGKPSVLEISTEHDAYLAGVASNPRFDHTVGSRRAWSYKLVEIEPLLAWQLHVLADRVNAAQASVPHAPSVGDMLPICLPYTLENTTFRVSSPGPHSLTVQSGDLNLRPHAPSMVSDPTTQLITAGATFGASSNLIQVAVIDGRYYLHNGFHRAVGLRLAGATHIPCIVFEAQTISDVAVPGKGFSARVLTASNPPTVGHFARGLGHKLLVRKLRRELEISYSIREREVPDE